MLLHRLYCVTLLVLRDMDALHDNATLIQRGNSLCDDHVTVAKTKRGGPLSYLHKMPNFSGFLLQLRNKVW